MIRKLIIGVMGSGINSDADRKAFELGALIAGEGWVLLNGGRNAGVMNASAKGAKSKNGITIGILPDGDTRQVSGYIDFPIVTGMGSARNCINVLSSDIIVACCGGAGTLSEIALALKSRKPVILMDFEVSIVFDSLKEKSLLFKEESPHDVIKRIKDITTY
ncbi:MAG: TIGR00725 family protein [Desulfobacterales bacterium]|nr:TIGR00725 family protein [Desulfobacterales bacterium]